MVSGGSQAEINRLSATSMYARTRQIHCELGRESKLDRKRNPAIREHRNMGNETEKILRRDASLGSCERNGEKCLQNAMLDTHLAMERALSSQSRVRKMGDPKKTKAR